MEQGKEKDKDEKIPVKKNRKKEKVKNVDERQSSHAYVPSLYIQSVLLERLCVSLLNFSLVSFEIVAPDGLLFSSYIHPAKIYHCERATYLSLIYSFALPFSV